jgi:hypothetical protein
MLFAGRRDCPPACERFGVAPTGRNFETGHVVALFSFSSNQSGNQEPRNLFQKICVNLRNLRTNHLLDRDRRFQERRNPFFECVT